MPTFANQDGSFLGESQGAPLVVEAPASGTTVALRWNQTDVWVANAAALATLTVQLPKRTANGTIVRIGCQSAITALTVQDGFGNAITGAPTAGAPGAAIEMRWINKAIGWVHWK